MPLKTMSSTVSSSMSSVDQLLERKSTTVLTLTLILDKFFTLFEEFRKTVQELHESCHCVDTTDRLDTKRECHRLDREFDQIMAEYNQYKPNIDTQLDPNSDVLPSGSGSMAIKPWYSCDYTDCQFRTQYTRSLNRHKQCVHLNLTCNQCHKVFADVSLVELHIKSCHINSITGNAKPLIRCKVGDCDYQSISGNDIKRHKESMHSMRSDLSCNQCPFKCHNFYAYNQHMNLHKNLTAKFKLKCHKCGKAFASMVSLRTHINVEHIQSNLITRNQLNRYECYYPNCEYTHKLWSIITRHVNNHLSRTPKRLKSYIFMCEICGQTYMHLKSMRRHFSSVHTLYEKQYYKCGSIGCPFKTDVLVQMFSHNSQHEPYTIDTITFNSVPDDRKTTAELIDSTIANGLHGSDDVLSMEMIDSYSGRMVSSEFAIPMNPVANELSTDKPIDSVIEVIESESLSTRPNASNGDNDFVFGSNLLNQKNVTKSHEMSPINGDSFAFVLRSILSKKSDHNTSHRNYCNKCNVMLASETAYNNHMMRRHSTHRCLQCSLVFEDFEQLIQHSQNECSQISRIYICEQYNCFFECTDSLVFDDHKRTHLTTTCRDNSNDIAVKTEPIDSDKCDDMCGEEQGLNVRTLVATDRQTVSVESHCIRESESRVELNSGDNTNKTGTDLLSKIDVKTESADVDNSSDKLVENANVILKHSYTKRKRLPTGRRRARGCKCLECLKHYANASSLRKHISAHHEPRVCERCGLRFISRNAVNQHLKICVNIPTDNHNRVFKCDSKGCRFECNNCRDFNEHKSKHLAQNIDKIITEFQDGIHRTEVKQELDVDTHCVDMNEFLEVNNDVNCDLNGQMGDSQVVTTDDQYLESPIIQSSHTCQANSSVCENIFSQKNTSRLRGLNSPREPIRLATDSTKKISELFKKYKK